ncbi:glycosyltransferase family 2 protein [Rhodobacter sp. Har01]|uniref:glycosyltransferase family 2 protein n=1 Tax=Rhodobacter sp. Har01 TaxID=2883999 RepID=UPI001D085375|nr:glycosyltransferase family 2 protein [Rhodobacter sp. Har01]MCB6177688.1 glycosyltransferase family 2 protein [Rhodobacter sp. Har01]
MTGPAADWALVATVKAPQEQVLAFIAHHLDLGAARIWVYFDDPDDPAFATVSRIRGVTAIRCTAQHWAQGNGRPERHQNRQARNAARTYRLCELPWLGHIDVDEFLLPDRPMGEILAALPAPQSMLRVEPFEALHDPALPDDIFTARAFRGPLKQRFAFLHGPIFGRFAPMLTDGMLSHVVGKVFFRTGIKGLTPRLHGASRNGERVPGLPVDPRVKLLHFHAQDRAAWIAALPFRLQRGAYQKRDAMRAALAGASPEEVEAFYRETQMLSAEKAAMLRSEGRLVEVDLSLRRKVVQMLARRLAPD